MASKREPLSFDLQEQLEELATCEISDALVKLGYRTGGHIPHLNIYSPREIERVRLVGRAFTVKLVEQEKTGEEGTNGPKTQEHFVDAAPEQSIMLISPDSAHRAACWGGLMSTAAKSKGMKGAVILGGCRDLAEHRQLGFPVFAQFHSTLGLRTFLRPSEYDIPLEIPVESIVEPRTGLENKGKTIVNPGDILVGDIDGVVVIPFDKVEEVIKVAQEGKAVDEKVRIDLEKGKGVRETMKKWRGT
ncbi:uncharacterized protein IL334_003243 [Kwoniella shivajii]|uniref:RraA-like protein n=1 Tax=Kwoniella shivajii TaxID=564305 RepID=A0ABZ1CYP4_9TREE|nr:hypothetical protein IL334_003243 [Kwoniella shivajii]